VDDAVFKVPSKNKAMAVAAIDRFTARDGARVDGLMDGGMSASWKDAELRVSRVAIDR
jgi:hypothetical protein